TRPPEDPVLQSLGQIADKKQPCVFIAQGLDEIQRALDFADEQQIPAVIWGAREAYRCLDRLKAASRGVIVQVNWGNEPPLEPNKPSETLVSQIKDPLRVQHDRIDRWKKTVAGLKDLAQEKVPFAIGSEGLGEPVEVHKSLRQAIAAGLP